jgi:hypothetical protein
MESDIPLSIKTTSLKGRNGLLQIGVNNMCMIDSGDGFWEHYTTGTHTARKAHTCGECGREIKPKKNINGILDYGRVDGIQLKHAHIAK